MGAEVPVWVGGLEKWVTGITKQTTCDEIVKALLRSSSLGSGSETNDYRQYVMVERWRRVERPLDGRSRILKVWRTWGEEQPHVRLTLRRLAHPLPLSDTTSKTTRKHQRDEPENHPKQDGAVFRLWRSAHNRRKSNTIHPRKLALDKGKTVSMDTKPSSRRPRKQAVEDADSKRQVEAHDRCVTSTMERLMRMILVQGETIQAQLRRMRDKDDQIEFFEQKMHELRLEELGANYLLDSYLNAEVGATNRVAPEPEGTTCPEPEDITQCISYYERTIETAERLEAQEHAICWLTAQLAQEQDATLEGVTVEPHDDSEVQMLVKTVGEELQEQMSITSSNQVELYENDATLAEMDRHLPVRRKAVARLLRELQAAESETLRLKTVWRECCVQAEDELENEKVEAGLLVTYRKDKHSADTDSNSDTGLSSLHSSGDEGMFNLDTLV